MQFDTWTAGSDKNKISGLKNVSKMLGSICVTGRSCRGNETTRSKQDGDEYFLCRDLPYYHPQEKRLSLRGQKKWQLQYLTKHAGLAGHVRQTCYNVRPRPPLHASKYSRTANILVQEIFAYYIARFATYCTLLLELSRDPYILIHIVRCPSDH